jgi:hypothetical protein
MNFDERITASSDIRTYPFVDELVDTVYDKTEQLVDGRTPTK